MLTPEEEKIAGEEAKQLLTNPAFAKHLRDMEVKIVEQLATFDISDDRILRLQNMLAAKRMFERCLRTTIQTGQLVIEDERRKATMRDKARAFFR